MPIGILPYVHNEGELAGDERAFSAISPFAVDSAYNDWVICKRVGQATWLEMPPSHSRGPPLRSKCVYFHVYSSVWLFGPESTTSCSTLNNELASMSLKWHWAPKIVFFYLNKDSWTHGVLDSWTKWENTYLPVQVGKPKPRGIKRWSAMTSWWSSQPGGIQFQTG